MKTRRDETDDTGILLNKRIDSYLSWASAQIEKLTCYSTLLEQQQDKVTDGMVRDIFDLAHNIKGLGGSFGFYLMTDIADSLCRYTRSLNCATEIQPGILHAHVTALANVSRNVIRGSGGGDGDETLMKLRDMVQRAAPA